MGAYWEHFSGTVPGLLLFGAAMACTYLVTMVDLIMALTVSGTRARFAAVSILKVLVLPAVVLLGTQLFINLVTTDWFNVIVDTFLISIFFMIRARIKDEDSWWTGMGTRLKKRLQSLASGLSSRAGTAPAGA